MVDFPTLVQAAVALCSDLWANDPARRHCADDLTGLRGAAKQTVSGLHGSWVVPTAPSCLPRWRNEVTWDVQALNDRRLAGWQGEPTTPDSPRGGMAIEPTLVAPAGQLSADVGGWGDHANARDVLAPEARRSPAGGPARAPAPLAW